MPGQTPVKPLVSLADWNKSRREEVLKKYQPNGIRCPKCGTELVDESQAAIKDSFPPQLWVFCPTGDFSSKRVK